MSAAIAEVEVGAVVPDISRGGQESHALRGNDSAADFETTGHRSVHEDEKVLKRRRCELATTTQPDGRGDPHQAVKTRRGGFQG